MDRREILNYMKEQKHLLDTGSVDKINLKFVCPRLIDEIFGGIEGFDINGWEGDYWGVSDNKYSVFGCMYDGTATISFEESEDEEE